MKALPQAIAGASFHKRDHRREVERRDAGDDAERLAHRIDVDARAGAVGIFALHQMRRAERELDHLDAALDVALGVGDRLAVLAGENVGEFVIVAGDEVEELHQHAGAALRVGGGPGRLRGGGVLDRGANFGLGGERDSARAPCRPSAGKLRPCVPTCRRRACRRRNAHTRSCLRSLSQLRGWRLLCRMILRTAIAEIAHRLCGIG